MTYHNLVSDIVCPVLFAADDDRNVFRVVAVFLQRFLKGRALRAARERILQFRKNDSKLSTLRCLIIDWLH